MGAVLSVLVHPFEHDPVSNPIRRVLAHAGAERAPGALQETPAGSKKARV